MTSWKDFVRGQVSGSSPAGAAINRPIVGSFGDAEAEYRALADGPALVDRTCRGLLEISGADRVSWLHNLTTNDMKNLSAGDGQYAFVLNIKGRILFDLNICVRKDSIWLDLDHRFLSLARGHFERYVITEDVSIADFSDEFVRIGLVGRAAQALLADLGVGHAATMPWLGTTEMTWDDCTIPLMRHDFCGPFAVEMYVPAAKAVGLWQSLTDSSRTGHAIPVGDEAVQIRRIEAGFPWPFREITDEYLPAETNQLERAVSFTKGCYLGQEVVERMRSRDVVARRLVGLRLDGEAVPPTGATLNDEHDNRVGLITSTCLSPAVGGVIGLGYAKTTSADGGTALRALWAGHSVRAIVAELPFTSGIAK